jgi:hypothetical protein
LVYDLSGTRALGAWSQRKITGRLGSLKRDFIRKIGSKRSCKKGRSLKL